MNKPKSPSPMDALCQVWLKLAQWFWRRRFFFISSMYFRYLCNYLPLEKDGALNLKKTWIPFTQECFVPSLVEIGPVVLEKKIFKFRQCIFAICVIISPWKRAGALHLNKLESPSPKDALCQVWLKLAQWFRTRRWKSKRFTDRRTDGRTDSQTTDNRWSEKLTWAFSSGELKTYDFDLRIKGQGHIEVMMVPDTSCHGDTTMCQIWFAYVKEQRSYIPETNLHIQTDRQWFLYTLPKLRLLGYNKTSNLLPEELHTDRQSNYYRAPANPCRALINKIMILGLVSFVARFIVMRFNL